MEPKTRFLNYIAIDTQSNPYTKTTPSTSGQKRLGQYLVNELHDLGIANAYMDEFGYVYAYLPSNCESTQTIGLIAHMDTSFDASGKDICPQIIPSYDGGDIVLSEKSKIILSKKDFPSLEQKIGHELIVTSGETLLGADDKAGICIIVSAIERLLKENLPHLSLLITFTPDEEIGEGTDHFNYALYQKYNCDLAYTLDGGDIRYISFENFNAASCLFTIHGTSIHPGSAKGKMRNSMIIGMEIQSMLPVHQVPESTENREGFYHLTHIEGTVEQTTMEYIIRHHDYTKFLEQKELIMKIAEYLNQKYGPSTIDISIQDSYYNMRERILERPEVLTYAIKALKRNHIEPEFEAIRGGTDGARLTFEGIYTPNLGTGGENFHGPYEYLDVTQMLQMIDVVITLLRVVTEK
ncbi:MAG: peptidase T [Prevotella sp.]|nr:peptidase T [Staphylococcus sp.]MCM1349597.1 peptidase T [Prevotella sp.]